MLPPSSVFQVISAHKGEFKTGYERRGQTHEHVQLAKTLGVAKLFVVVNKMDEDIVGKCFVLLKTAKVWDKLNMISSLFAQNVEQIDVLFLSISGQKSTNMKTRVDSFHHDLAVLSGIVFLTILFPLSRIPIIYRVKDTGAVVMGKVKSGTVSVGDSLLRMPNKMLPYLLMRIVLNVLELGENLRIKLSKKNRYNLANPIPTLTEFVTQLVILELLDNAILHMHSAVEECEIVELLQQIDTKTHKPLKKKVLFVKTGAAVL
ncbi:Eukaryotic peptide chain release factor GTP-binding subunit [Glycine soja]